MGSETLPPDQRKQGAEAEELLVFLFAGQSNMAGADALIDGDGTRNLEQAGLQTEADRATSFTYGPNFSEDPETGFQPWGDVRGHGSSSVQVHGPEVGFARTLYEEGIRDIAIIKVAANIPYESPGRETWPWGKGEKNNARDYYGRWREFVSKCLAQLEQDGYCCKIGGFVWHQGIDDAINQVEEDVYAERLCELIADLRGEYDCTDAPFVLARSANSPIATAASMAPIRAAQVKVAEEDDCAQWIDVDDLPNVNRHHFSAAAQLIIGRRFGEAYLELR